MQELRVPMEFSVKSARELGLSLAERYQSASPYPHVQLDDFLEPSILEKVLEQLANHQVQEAEAFQRSQERNKFSYNPDELPVFTRSVFDWLNSQAFLTFLEAMTGIKGLIPDPYYLGGGIHEVRNGGHLNIHADFNHHPKLDLERRINLLIYLNKDWREEYGGQFEFWDKAMKNRLTSVTPIFNRCVVFNTTSESWHGNPNPVNHPNGLSRRSIALYYYTATWDDSKRKHTTQFKVRPNSQDEADWSVKRRELAYDWLPPAVLRWLRSSRSR